MKVESIELFYLSMPEVLDIGDGSQDALLVRVRAGGLEGYGECEAAPLPSIAALVCPMSHSACKPVCASVLGEPLRDAADIRRIGALVRAQSLDLLQADHLLSGIDIALWDLLGRREQAPVWQLLGYERAYPKTPYASALFGDTPAETLAKGRAAQAAGYRAVKFGWGPFGRGTVQDDIEQVLAAREAIGDDGILLVDAGTVFGEDLEAASARAGVLRECRATWFEEPFVKDAYAAHRALAGVTGEVRLAGGEGSHTAAMAINLVEQGALGYVQIDAGRIGGITAAKQVADYAAAHAVTYVNHTFTSHLALSASLQPYAGLEDHSICEYPIELKPLAAELTTTSMLPDANGQVTVPDGVGYGIEVDLDTVRRYLVETEIRVGGRVLYATPVP